MSFYLLLLAGFLSGIFGGMGMGGGTLLIPLLTLVFDIPQKTAQMANLISFLPMAFVSLKIHSDNRLLEKKHTGYIILPAVTLSAVGSFTAIILPSVILRKAFGGFLCILSFFQFFSLRNCLQRKKNRVK